MKGHLLSIVMALATLASALLLPVSATAGCGQSECALATYPLNCCVDAALRCKQYDKGICRIPGKYGYVLVRGSDNLCDRGGVKHRPSVRFLLLPLLPSFGESIH